MDNYVASPEKPLSPLGLLAYRSYWSSILMDLFVSIKGMITIEILEQTTCIDRNDIIDTLFYMGLELPSCKNIILDFNVSNLSLPSIAVLKETFKPLSAMPVNPASLQPIFRHIWPCK